jgi:hypothetical protein
MHPIGRQGSKRDRYNQYRLVGTLLTIWHRYTNPPLRHKDVQSFVSRSSGGAAGRERDRFNEVCR